MTPRRKADDITRYIREEHNLSSGDFTVLRMTAEPKKSGTGIFSQNRPPNKSRPKHLADCRWESSPERQATLQLDVFDNPIRSSLRRHENGNTWAKILDRLRIS
jgi:hypothetical protein